MKLKEILHALSNDKNITLDLVMVQDIAEFQTGEDVRSIKNLAFILDGHFPIQRFYFDIDKLRKWCKENNLLFMINDADRLLYLRRK